MVRDEVIMSFRDKRPNAGRVPMRTYEQPGQFVVGKSALAAASTNSRFVGLVFCPGIEYTLHE